MESLILNPIDPFLLIGLGFLLIASEMLVTAFIMLWFGLGIIIVGIISYFYAYTDGIWQLASASIIALLLLIFLRNKFVREFLSPVDKLPEENFLNEEGQGVIKDVKVYYKSIFWTPDNLAIISDFEEGEVVDVLEALKGKAKIRKIIKK